MVMDLKNKREEIIFNPQTPGYAGTGESFMDFPYFPSFWNPRIMNKERVIITGIPEGGVSREFYLLKFISKENE
jgi:hypothetical protein